MYCKIKKKGVIKMRSIGAKYIKLVKKLTQEEMKKANGLGCPDYNGVRDSVLEKIPNNVFESWESANSEIERIIEDEIMAIEK
jgi:hypothetical protein